MERTSYTPYIFSVILLFSLMAFSPSVEAIFLFDHDLSGETITSDNTLDIELGLVNEGEMISISFFASDKVDVILLTDSQYNSWNNQDYIVNGSEIDTNIVIYTWTAESTDNYWAIIDNSFRISGGADVGVDVTLSSGYIDISESILGEYKSRLFIEPNSYYHYDFGVRPQDEVLHMSINCKDWFSNDLDIFLVKDENKEDFLNGQDFWDRNATILESCLEIWDFELIESGRWHIFVENGPRGDAGADSEGVLVDVFFFGYENFPTVIQSTTRMIESSDVWRVELGNLNAKEIVSFTLIISNEYLADLDVLIMASAEADKYILGQQSTVLGHASLINTGSLDSWDYTFPDSGYYSLILDNSESPVGGASENKALQVKINVQEVTILGDWLGWYQSRHYVESGDFVSFDLGNLEPEDEIYYTVSGTSFGSGFLNRFDLILMTDSQYNIYTSGGSPQIIDEASDMDTWISIFQNYTIESADRYWLIIDAADGPDNGADSNDAWTFDFIIKSSRNQIISPQVKDSNYEMIVTHPDGTNLIDIPDDEQLIDNSNQNNQQTQDDNTDNEQPNIGDAQSKSEDSTAGLGTGCGAFSLVLVIVFIVRKRRRGSAEIIIQNNTQLMATNYQPTRTQPPYPTQGPQNNTQQMATNYPPKPPQPPYPTQGPQNNAQQMATNYPPKPTRSPDSMAFNNQVNPQLSSAFQERVNQHKEESERMRWGQRSDYSTSTNSRNDILLQTEKAPINQMGYLGADGYYWLEWPIGSGKWYHRSETNQAWSPLKN